MADRGLQRVTTSMTSFISLPSTPACALPQYKKYEPLQHFDLAERFCNTHNRQAYPNGNVLCALLANLQNEEQGRLSTAW